MRIVLPPPISPPHLIPTPHPLLPAALPISPPPPSLPPSQSCRTHGAAVPAFHFVTGPSFIDIFQSYERGNYSPANHFYVPLYKREAPTQCRFVASRRPSRRLLGEWESGQSGRPVVTSRGRVGTDVHKSGDSSQARITDVGWSFPQWRALVAWRAITVWRGARQLDQIRPGQTDWPDDQARRPGQTTRPDGQARRPG